MCCDNDYAVEETLTDCPDCGSEATMTDSGLVCSNPDCENS